MKNEKGFSLVELLIVLLIIGVIAQLAIPNLLRSRMAGNEGSAINTVRTIISAEMLYVTTRGGGRYGSLDVLSQGSLLDSVVGSATKDGYTFSISLGPADSTYNVNARPVNYDNTGRRSFFGDESGVIRYSTANAPATSGSPILGQ